MSKTAKIVVIVLLVIAIGVLSFYYFNSKDATDPVYITDPENGDDEVPENGEETEPENGEETEPENGEEEPVEKIELKDNYSFSLIEPEFEDEIASEILLNRVNDNEYDFEMNMNILSETEEEFFQNKMMVGFILFFMPHMYAPALNKDFAEHTYNLTLEDPEYSFEDDLMFFDVGPIPEEPTFEEYFSLLREGFLKTTEMDLSDAPEDSDLAQVFVEYNLVLEEMFNQEINFRNVTLAFNSIFEGEVYPDGYFKYEGDEKRVYFKICDVDAECHSLFEEDEWVHLDDFFDALDQAEDNLDDFLE